MNLVKLIKNYLTLLKNLGASKKDLFFKVVLPSNFSNIINNLKINTSMAYIGVIMGELLVSKKGLGYLIMYGSQVFNINLVITSVFLLGVFAFFILPCYLSGRKNCCKRNRNQLLVSIFIYNSIYFFRTIFFLLKVNSLLES